VADVDSSNFNGGNLTVTIASGEDSAEDVLSLSTSGTVALASTNAGAKVSVGGTVVGTLANAIAAGNDLVVNLNTAATVANVQTLVRAITYQDTDTDNPTTGNRTVQVGSRRRSGLSDGPVHASWPARPYPVGQWERVHRRLKMSMTLGSFMSCLRRFS